MKPAARAGRIAAMHRRALLLAPLALPAVAHAAPRAEAWERWRRHDPDSRVRIDHAAWDGLLSRFRRPHADGIARFAYPEARAAQPELAAYLSRLQAADVDRLARPEQFAFWANLYNALTVAVVLENWPVGSIREIRSGVFTPGPWGRRLARVAGEELTLDDIEHRILRPLWRDARVHYAVNCAALGCPNLPPHALSAATLDADLDAWARAFVNHPRGARIEGGRLVVSSIYHWFAEDFGEGEQGVIAHLSRFAAPPLAAALAGRTRIDRHAYDWAINAG